MIYFGRCLQKQQLDRQWIERVSWTANAPPGQKQQLDRLWIER